MNIHPFRASVPSLDRIFNPALFFSKAKHLYAVYYKNGYFTKLDKKGLFVYRQRNSEMSHVGIIAATHVQDYLQERIIKHEETLEAKEEKMVRLFEERNGQIKPVLLTYPTVPEIDNFLKDIIETREPDQHIEYKEAEHDIWFLQSEKDYKYVQQLFKDKIEKAYIADGHHRAATLSRYYRYALDRLKVLPENSPYNYLFCAFFGTNELTIADYNRVVKVDEHFDKNAFIEALKTVGHLSLNDEPFKPKRKHELAIIIDNQWYRLRWTPKIIKHENSRLKQLDVSLLNKQIFNNILKMEDIRSSEAIAYIGGDKGINGVLDKMKSANSQTIGFMLAPISITDFMQIVDKEGVMPPKSTYFMPRIHNAFVNLMFDN
ncbi:MAG: DUF1015 family protein [Saprospiraceae bacterium]